MELSDRDILRDLVNQFLEICSLPEQNNRRDLWRRHNSLKRTPVLIYTRSFAWKEMPESTCKCQDSFYRYFENFFRNQLYWYYLGDDSVFEPWVTVHATYRCTGWGFQVQRNYSDELRGSYKNIYPLTDPELFQSMRAPWHEIDEETTSIQVEKLSDAIGDLITINIDRAPAYRMWTGDISTDLGHFRGIENFMLDMYDRPEWLHHVLAFFRDGILRTHEQAEQVGDWGLSAHQNQAMPYAEELPDPAANSNGIKRKQLWGYMAAQEYTLVSPAFHDRFLLQYQLPILKEFGLTAYGCCEDLTKKIKILRQIPNLRRIAVAPAANVHECAEQIGDQYILSYRPSPTDMVGYGFDSDRIRSILRRDLAACKANGCHTDITLKDVETVQGDPDRVRTWVKITRDVIDEVFGE